MPIKCRLISPEAFAKLETSRLAQRLSLMDRYKPGAMWYATWLHDPSRAGHRDRIIGKLQAAERAMPGTSFLSAAYWRERAEIRPPIVVLLPIGKVWCVDGVMPSGECWTLTGQEPHLTATPEVDLYGYRGSLRDGVFTDG